MASAPIVRVSLDPAGRPKLVEESVLTFRPRPAPELGPQRGTDTFDPESLARVKNATDAYEVTRSLFEGRDRELIATISLDCKSYVLGIQIVSMGSRYSAPVNVRDMFRAPILLGAQSVYVLHNHIFDCRPGDADLYRTREIALVGDLLGIELADHVIVSSHPGRPGFQSIRETAPRLFQNTEQLHDVVTKVVKREINRLLAADD